MGGLDLGPSPFQFLTAALAECTVMTVRWYARKNDWAVRKISVEVAYEPSPHTGDKKNVDGFQKTVRIDGETLTLEQRKKLLDVAGKCPVQRTLERGCLVTTLWSA
ncbi:MAG: OsmC family peroxiredoxin [Cytophagaceae bacterium]|nr:MAG: OsmC family peroxiredoxin [Cytophagaceae bacterium]